MTIINNIKDEVIEQIIDLVKKRFPKEDIWTLKFCTHWCSNDCIEINPHKCNHDIKRLTLTQILSANNSLTLNFIKKHIDKEWNWGRDGLSGNTNLQLEWILAFPDKDWCWGKIPSNKNFNLDWVEKLFPYVGNDIWNWKSNNYEDFEINYGLSDHPNFQLEWILKYPDKDWKWSVFEYQNCYGYGLSSHPNLQLEWIEKFPDKPWDFSCMDDLDDGYIDDIAKGLVGISHNPHLQLEWIEKYPDKDWNWEVISRHSNLQIEWLEKFPDKDWDWYFIFTHPNIKLDWLWIEGYHYKKIPHEIWEEHGGWSVISENPNLTLEFIEKTLTTYIGQGCIIFYPDDWNWIKMSSNPNLQLEWIKKYPEQDWDWKEMSLHKNLQLEWLESFPDKEWDWKEMSLHKNLQLEWLESFPDKDWDWGRLGISENTNLKLEWINKFPDKDWKWDMNGISGNEGLQLELLENYPNKNWCWSQVSDSYNINFKWLESLSLYLDFAELSHHTEIEFKWIEGYLNKKWNWNIIITNSFEKEVKIRKRWRILLDLYSNYLPLELAHIIVLYAGF